jgi:transposase
VIIDHTNRRVLDVLESREKEFVIKSLREEVESGLLAGVEEVTCDMWDGYVTAAQETFGKDIRITIDRFHVMKSFQEQLTDARRQIQRGLDKGEAKALKGTRWLWVKNWENLTEQERAELEELKKRFPLLQQLAEQRGSLRAIFEDRKITGAAEGRQRLEAWIQGAKGLGLKGLEAFSSKA